MLNNIKTVKSERGFTIVELLIVIVVIAILAAITIVAYNGIQNRAKTTAGQSLANSVVKKLESYNAVVGSYPTTRTQIQGLTESKIDGLPATHTTIDSDGPLILPAADTINGGVALTGTNAGGGKAVRVNTATATGGTVQYWNYEGSGSLESLSYGAGS